MAHSAAGRLPAWTQAAKIQGQSANGHDATKRPAVPLRRRFPWLGKPSLYDAAATGKAGSILASSSLLTLRWSGRDSNLYGVFLSSTRFEFIAGSLFTST